MIMKTFAITNSNIKGYHNFKIRPSNDIEMSVEKELDNLRDPKAMVIRMPKINMVMIISQLK